MIRLSAFADESDNSLEGQIAGLKRNGLSLLEIRNINGKNVMELTDEEAKAIRARLDEEGIKMWSIGSPIGKKDISISEEEHLADVRRGCELAKILGAENIRCFSFYNAETAHEKMLDLMKKTVAIGNEYGIRMCHENDKGLYGDNLARTKEVLDNTPGLYYVYDPANFIQVGEKAEDTLSQLADRAFYFHIKDVVAETGELVPAGYGDGDLLGLVSRIKGDKVLTVEPHLKIFAGYVLNDKTVLKTKFQFTNNVEAFDAAVSAIKKVLVQAGYREEGGVFVK
ncbi:MAG: sugar phosphate isomerase/epimerase [Clostridia bacterium]|nr:sugar phosphate isomerase/epimerase [Clostridia bacterium]